MSVIEFKPPAIQHKIEPKKVNYVSRWCVHAHLIVSREDRTIECAGCKKEIEAFEAILIVSNLYWRQEYDRERELEYNEKYVARVQRAAVENLHAHGVTPEIYAERWAKREAEVKAQVIAIEEKRRNVLDIGEGNKGA